MTQLMVNRICPRIAAMFSTLTDGGSYLKIRLGEEDAADGFRIPKPSSQFNESTDHDREFQAWWARQQEMKENISEITNTTIPGLLKACWTNMTTLTLTPNPLKAGIKLAVVRSRFQLFAACLTVIQCLKSLKCNHPMDQNPRVTPKPVIIKRTKRLPGIERNLLKIINLFLL